MPHLDAQADFARARRHGQLARLAGWLTFEPDDVRVILPFEEVIKELGFVSERTLGRQVVPLDQIVGSVDRTRDFDRSFRPTSPRTRGRWERIAAAMRRGEAMPPVSLYRIGEICFVRDGHHRISVARALGWKEVEADVTEVKTRVGAESEITLADLLIKGYERLFRSRVPLQSGGAREDHGPRPVDVRRNSARPSRHGASGRCSTNTASSAIAEEVARGGSTEEFTAGRSACSAKPIWSGSNTEARRGLPPRPSRTISPDPHA